MKKPLFLALLVLTSFQSFSKDVDSVTAALVARNFYLQNVAAANSQSLFLSLADAGKIESFNPVAQATGAHLYYVFNVNSTDGFVIVTGDDVVVPILGYSVKGKYDKSNLPPAFQKWMDGYKGQIIMAKENRVTATPEIELAWNNLINGVNQHAHTRGAVPALLSTTWNQSPYYNDDCPYDYSCSCNCVTGCVATAMAQIMKYWNYPDKGSGFHSYYLSSYGTLTANFGSTTFNWSSMPGDVSSSNNAVATLMYDCGVSVEMNYSPNESGAWVIDADNPVCAQNAFTTYFGYNSSTIQGLMRDNYSDADWTNLLKNELNNSRPVQYVGSGGGGGHTWVCDGYDANSYFHMNWGWGSIADGNYDINALNPTAVGIGGGLGSYNDNQEALIGIQPTSGGGGSTTAASVEMNSDITVTPDPIDFNQPFTVNADLYNAGTSDFNGTFCAALFNSSGDFIAYIDSIQTGSYPLSPTYSYPGGLTFSNDGMLTVPGSYLIGIYYRPDRGNWFLAGNSFYTNPINITINSPIGNTNGSPNNLEIYSAISPSPLTFVQGKPASVNVDIANFNNYTYYGDYVANLYDLDNNFVETIGTFSETTGLPPGDDYLSPYVTFTTNSVTADPGTYLLAIGETEQGVNGLYYVGGDYYPNPINVNVIAPPLPPDIYEPDNNAPAAYNLTLNWSANTANPQTTGSNIHIGSDYDYYKIDLADGYNYTITARVHDSYNSGNGNTYTCDVLWSYDAGTGWSSSYNDIMPGNIMVTGAGIVTFFVAPYFQGLTGTYLLDIHVARTAGAGIENIESSSIKIYPDPANDLISLDYSPGKQNFERIEIRNTLGQIVLSKETNTSAIQSINIAALANGIYYLEAINDEQKFISKFVINH